MKLDFYPKLAWTSITKNRKLYFPYLMTCICMVAVYFIICSTCSSPVIAAMPGGLQTQAIMGFGKLVIAFFSLLFLFYTNTFLLRRRSMEFGLYNILGMSKRNIVIIALFETLIVAGISLTAGLFFGLLLSKLSELCLLRLIKVGVDFKLFFSANAFFSTLVVFSAIFLLILLNTVIRICKLSSLSLLRSENAGEKPPKANWLVGILGVILLVAAYYISVTIDDPITALLLFFVAVIMVIAATYAIFVSGSVVLCRLLQKNKGYYYKPNHFVSVSSMAFRMNRNGASLASICILLTMVLVTMASTACLYIGSDDALRTRYPRSINVTAALSSIEGLSRENTDIMRERIGDYLSDSDITADNYFDYSLIAVQGYLSDDSLIIDKGEFDRSAPNKTATYAMAHFIPLEEYNFVSGTNYKLSDGESLLFCTRCDYSNNSIDISECGQLRIAQRMNNNYFEDGIRASSLPSMLFIMNDPVGFISPAFDGVGIESSMPYYLYWNYSFDIDAPEELHPEISNNIGKVINGCSECGLEGFSSNDKEGNIIDYYSTFGSLFFFGILLSLVFMFATVLMIYYKQISEGYEDQSRFEIMQSVGMTKEDIRRSINSQILTVFFIPIVFAVLHYIFAFPMIRIILTSFGLYNLKLLILTSAGCVVLLTLIYAFIYRITAKSYYSILTKS